MLVTLQNLEAKLDLSLWTGMTVRHGKVLGGRGSLLHHEGLQKSKIAP